MKVEDDVSAVSFPVDVRRLPARGFPVRIAADAAQCEALAAFHGLVAVRRFEADLLVRRWKGDGVIVTGTVTADIVQSCVVTLRPVEATVAEAIEAVLVPEGSALDAPHTGEIHVDPEGADVPETFAGHEIDAGALAEEFFELGIDPYPRHPDSGEFGQEGADPGAHPFAALAEWRKKQ